MQSLRNALRVSARTTLQRGAPALSRRAPIAAVTPILIDHYTRPRNPGSMDRKDPMVGTGLVGAPACGDVMKLQIKVDNGTITDAKFKTFGCGSAIASSSYLTELVKGMRIEDAAKIRNTDIANNLHLPPVKLHCSMLAEDAIRAAIADYHTKNPPTNLGKSEVKTLEMEKSVQRVQRIKIVLMHITRTYGLGCEAGNSGKRLGRSSGPSVMNTRRGRTESWLVCLHSMYLILQ
ncbi:iron sulfur cluster assembly protein 2 [Pyricularia oryzae]|nr:iron sulfur cluster assembly protein 2 [Pyricularia oryzae]KAI7929540.1 iron sulfur cluster assembly protein 2 [Pyricularia oryzae]